MALGGKPIVLSSVHFDCGEEAISALACRGVAAAGTIVNFIAGAIGLVAFRATKPVRKPHIAYFLWLFTTLNLLMGAGYFLFSGVGNIGDWAAVLSGIVSPLIWRPAMAVFGGALGQSRIGAAACEGAARNPGAAAKIQVMMILGLALIESLVLFALVIVFFKT